MRFGPWHPLDGAAAAAPERPGVLQARAEGLLSFPQGKSAMVMYAASTAGEPLSQLLRGAGGALVERARASGASWIRFGESSDPAAELARLLAHFVERFGAPPPGNAEGDP